MYASYESYFTTALTCLEEDFTWFMASATIAALFSFAFAINSLCKHSVLPHLSSINEMPESERKEYSEEETETHRIFVRRGTNKYVYEKCSYREKVS